jgi:hypothetical protein
MDGQSMNKFNFVMDGREYAAFVDREGDVQSVWDFGASRFLEHDAQSCERERPHVWRAAYGLLEA